jgi:adenylate cyclase
MKIFMSYRRADSEALTGRIRDRLVARYGDGSIFMDVENIPFGMDFRHHLQDALAASELVIAVIGPYWLGSDVGSGTRIHSPGDPVRVEIELARQLGKPIIPVLIGNTTMPAPEQLPEAMRDFSFVNAAQIDPGRDFHQHMERLIRAIDETLRSAHAAPRLSAHAAAATMRSSAEFAAGPSALSDKPSIAVLPFANIGADPEQEYFSDGISEDIITDLSKIAGLMVIARNSSFSYRGRAVDVRTIGRDLGVRSVLEGSIRRAGNRVRITAQLVDAGTGGHLWAERYDRDLTDIFALQDEVTRNIVDALKVKLTAGETSRLADARTSSLEAHDLALRAREFLRGQKFDRETLDQTVALLSRAIALDPDYVEPYAALAMAYNLKFHNDFTGTADALGPASHFAALAIQKGPSVPFAHFVAAVIAVWKGDLDEAKRETEIALTLSPNYAAAYGTRGLVEIYSGTPMEGVRFVEEAMRLDPSFSQQYMQFLGMAHLVAGNYEAAAASFRERIRLIPGTDLSRGLLISALGHLDQIDEAHRVWAELKAINPHYSFARHFARMPFRNPAEVERIKDGIVKAGITA